MNFKRIAIAAAIGLGIVGAAGLAQPFVQSAQAHAGMMGGYGPANGWGGGHAAGHGMMGGGYGGYGMGPGMMGGGRGGVGMGPGMMGGGYGGVGMGPGMMMGAAGLGPLDRLDLSTDQRAKISGIQDDLRKKNWELMGKMHDEMSTLGRDSAPGAQDRTAILAANKRMFELRQQMLENGLDAQGKVEAVLTPQQKEQYRKLAESGFDSDD